jgi:hypothetical protein
LNNNQAAVHFPIETLNLFDWAARWWVYNRLPASACPDIEDGVGIYRPRLTLPKREVWLSRVRERPRIRGAKNQ